MRLTQSGHKLNSWPSIDRKKLKSANLLSLEAGIDVLLIGVQEQLKTLGRITIYV